MQPLNNLDIIILIVLAISGFLAFNRGITKEIFSIIGWTSIILITVFLLPIINEYVALHVENVALASVIALAFILFNMFLFWMFFTKKIVGKVRDSKLSYFDRIFGLIFGLARGVLIIVLLNILVNWLAPKEYQSKVFQDSIYFEMAGVLAKPVEKMIPQATLRNIQEKSTIQEFINDGLETDSENDAETLFEKLTNPQIKKIQEEKEKLEELKEELKSYKDSETEDMNRLIDTTYESLDMIDTGTATDDSAKE